MSIRPDQATLDKFLALHSPEAREDAMVYSVWEDGEVTLEKGGELFGRRSLHCIAFGNEGRAWDPSLMPLQNADQKANILHGRIFVKEHADAIAARALILNYKG